MHIALSCMLLVLPPMLTCEELRIQHLANAGAMVSCGENSVIVDGLFREGVIGYETLDSAMRESLETAQAPFDRVVLLLATHNHRDHFDAESVARHLASNPAARFAGTQQTAGAVKAAGAANVEVVNRPSELQFPGGSVTFLRLPHNPPHRGNVENTGLLLRMCNRTLLFTGDADQRVEDFWAAGLKPGEVDVLLVPWWFLAGQNGRRVIDEAIQPKRIWALHGDTRNSEEWMRTVRSNYPNVEIGFK